MNDKNLYKVIFQKSGEVYELFAKNVYQSDLWNFLEIEEMVFNNKSSIVIDPSEERLQKEFKGVKRSFIPLQSILRIDEIETREPSNKVVPIVQVENKAKKDNKTLSTFLSD